MPAEPGDPPFLSLAQHRVVVGAEGHASTAAPYTSIERRALDATVIAAYYTHQGERHVYLRSCVRPPLALRASEPRVEASLWELPAGLVEPGESPEQAAVRELEEELGFRVPMGSLSLLGPRMTPAPALIGELHFFFCAKVDPSLRAHPAGDGSPLEQVGVVIDVPLSLALAACANGEIPDEKTELGLRRLAEVP